MDAIALACIDCDVWVGTTPIEAQAHTDHMNEGVTQEDLDAGRDAHDSFYVVNTSEGA